MLKRARISVSAIFFIHGLIVANWLSRIPAVKQSLALPVGVLGVALLGASAGALTSMSVISRVIGRYGSARVTRWTSFALCAVLPLPALAWNAATLTLFLFVYGAMAGAMDVAMNTQAVDVERGYGRPVMVSFHALFSFGGMMGGATGALAAGQGVAPVWHLAATAAFMAIATWIAARHLLAVEKEPVSSRKRKRLPFAPLAGLAAVAFCVLLGEGAMADWSAVYLTRFTGQGTAAIGYSVFSLFMATGRLTGDWLRARWGSVTMVRAGSVLAAVGLGTGLGVGTLIAGLMGFACAGAGWAAIFPITLSAGGRKAGSQPEAGVATVSATGYFAFLIGPPLIGFLAEATTLRLALGVVVLLNVVTGVMARVVREAD